MAKLLGMLGKCRSLAVLMLAVAAVAAVAAIAIAGAVETRAQRAATCGLAIHVQDPDLRASLVRFDRQQSAAARKLCASYRDRL